MRAAEHMRQVLRASGVYRLTGETPVDQELAAYGAGFAVVEDAWQALLEELFVATAPAARLDAWEALFRPTPSTAALETRREMVAEALAGRPGPVTAESLSAMLPAAGVRGAVSEGETGLSVTVESFLGVPEAEALLELDRLLPAHLEWSLAEAGTA